MADVREDTLARLLAVVAAIPNLRSSYRNNVEITEDEFPCGVVLDGDEETDDASDASMRLSTKPFIARMSPQIIIVDKGDLTGSDLDVFRRELIKRVLTDTELNEIVGAGRQGNGAIRYLGCITDVGWLRTMRVAVLTNFQFKYAQRVLDL
jgi:hypothetical protein